MKKLSALRDWTKVLFVLVVLPIIFVPGFTIMYFFFPDVIPVTFSFSGSGELKWLRLLVSLLIIAAYCCFVYALYLFRKILALFSKKKFFDDDVIKYFDQIGKLMYYGLLLWAVPFNLYLIVTQNEHELDTRQLVSIIFIGSLGFFFTVLSEVFQKAKNIKEENDLTI